MPTCGNPAAMTALPHPANVSQKVPIASAAYFCAFMMFSRRLIGICSDSCGRMTCQIQTVVNTRPLLQLRWGKRFVKIPSYFYHIWTGQSFGCRNAER
jgi:hypothetical protein